MHRNYFKKRRASRESHACFVNFARTHLCPVLSCPSQSTAHDSSDFPRLFPIFNIESRVKFTATLTIKQLWMLYSVTDLKLETGFAQEAKLQPRGI